VGEDQNLAAILRLHAGELGLEPGDGLALLTVLRSDAVGVPDAALVPLWESGLAKNVVKAPFAKDGTIGVGQLKMWAAARAKDGTLKPEELKWVGFNDWLDALIESDITKLSRDEVVNFVNDNAVRVEETMLGSRPLPLGFTIDPLEDGSGFTVSGAGLDATGQTESEAALFMAGRMERIAQQWQKNGDEEKARRYFIRAEALNEWSEYADGRGFGRETRYHGWQTPGGKGYKELLLTLPPNSTGKFTVRVDGFDGDGRVFDTYAEAATFLANERANGNNLPAAVVGDTDSRSEERAAIDDSPSVVAINYSAYDARSFSGITALRSAHNDAASGIFGKTQALRGGLASTVPGHAHTYR
jgi:hypothetical protein